MSRHSPTLAEGKLLYLEHLTVSFDGFKALNDLTLYMDPGELRCIIGPNGAGKTTMMDVITGKTKPDEGTAFFGQRIDLLRLTEPEIAEVLQVSPRTVHADWSMARSWLLSELSRKQSQ